MPSLAVAKASTVDIDTFRAILSGAKRIVVVAGDGLSQASRNPTLRDNDMCKRDDLSSPTPTALVDIPCSLQPSIHSVELALEAEPNAAHLALAHFALKHFRRTVTIEDSEFTLITENIDGLERRAIECVFASFGLPSPLLLDSAPSTHKREKPVLVEMYGPISLPSDDSVSVIRAIYSSLSTTFRYLSPHKRDDITHLIDAADVCVLVGLNDLHANELLYNSLEEASKRGSMLVALGSPSTCYPQSTICLEGPLVDLVPRAFAIGPYSRILDNGSIKTYYPGVTVTATASGGRNVRFENINPSPENTVPLYSKSYAPIRPPLIARPPMSRSELMSLTNKAIVELCQSSPSLTDTPLARELDLEPVHVLASNIIVKVGYQLYESEAKAATLVRKRTTIPVPIIYRFFQHEDSSYLVMEWVKGDCLDRCWDDLSNWQKLRIAVTLRNYVKQLRRIRTPQIEQQVPGPITDDPSQPLPCRTPALGTYPVSSFPSYKHLRDWMNGRCRVSQYMLRRRMDVQPFDDSEPLVFTHGDLCLRNIILGADGRLWLIDFGSAGVYPRWFEACGAREINLQRPPKMWTAARTIAIGDYRVQEKFDLACQYAFENAFCVPDPGAEWDKGL